MRRICSVFSIVAVLIAASPAFAGTHRVAAGETLIQIARVYGCSVEQLQKANNVDTTLIRAGAMLKVPSCKKVATRKAATTKVATSAGTATTTVVTTTYSKSGGQSVGKPWSGALHAASRLGTGGGYTIRRPERAYGSSHTVKQLERALAAFHTKFPKAHTVAIGDMSAKTGGAISDHRSHQSGRDVDVGFVFKARPASYPSSFVVGTADNLDLAATWGLLKAFVRTVDEERGVSNVFLDFDVQGIIYRWAKAHGVDPDYLDRLFQYPHGRGASAGIVRHWPKHADHFHIRFKCAPEDRACE